MIDQEILNRWLKKNGSIYLYSDPHFSDLECYKRRFPVTFQTGTESIHKSLVKHFDEEQVKYINSVCGKNDTLVILGDVGNIEYVKKLKANYKVLILGNHDKGASNYKRVVKPNEDQIKKVLESDMVTKNVYINQNDDKQKRDFAENFVRCGMLMGFKKYTEDNHLFDEVYTGFKSISDRIILSHEPFTPIPEYAFNIHGHVHDKDMKGDEHHLNVCAEAIDYKPVSLLSLIKKGLLKDIPNIHRPTIDKATERKINKVVDKK